MVPPPSFDRQYGIHHSHYIKQQPQALDTTIKKSRRKWYYEIGVLLLCCFCIIISLTCSPLIEGAWGILLSWIVFIAIQILFLFNCFVYFSNDHHHHEYTKNGKKDRLSTFSTKRLLDCINISLFLLLLLFVCNMLIHSICHVVSFDILYYFVSPLLSCKINKIMWITVSLLIFILFIIKVIILSTTIVHPTHSLKSNEVKLN